ncbi:hypothetical protein P5V15_006941 [Pogonomyrmex californicus]
MPPPSAPRPNSRTSILQKTSTWRSFLTSSVNFLALPPIHLLAPSSSKENLNLPDKQFWDQISKHKITDTVPVYISRDPLPYLVPIKAFRTAHPNPPPHLQPDPIDMLAITNFLPQLEQLGI